MDAGGPQRTTTVHRRASDAVCVGRVRVAQWMRRRRNAARRAGRPTQGAGSKHSDSGRNRSQEKRRRDCMPVNPPDRPAGRTSDSEKRLTWVTGSLARHLTASTPVLLISQAREHRDVPANAVRTPSWPDRGISLQSRTQSVQWRVRDIAWQLITIPINPQPGRGSVEYDCQREASHRVRPVLLCRAVIAGGGNGSGSS
jgi:hypothetical protein